MSPWGSCPWVYTASLLHCKNWHRKIKWSFYRFTTRLNSSSCDAILLKNSDLKRWFLDYKTTFRDSLSLPWFWIYSSLRTCILQSIWGIDKDLAGKHSVTWKFTRVISSCSTLISVRTQINCPSGFIPSWATAVFLTVVPSLEENNPEFARSLRCICAFSWFLVHHCVQPNESSYRRLDNYNIVSKWSFPRLQFLFIVSGASRDLLLC